MDPETTNEKIEKLVEKGFGELDGTYKLDSWIPNDDYAVKVGYSSTVDSLDPAIDISAGMGASYSFGEYSGTEDMFENQLRDKYPALKQAYEHYKNIKQMCETREQEENDS